MESTSEMIRRTKAQEIEARFPTCRLCKRRRMRDSYIVDHGIKVSTCTPCRIGGNRSPCAKTSRAVRNYVSCEVTKHQRKQEKLRLERRQADIETRIGLRPEAVLAEKPVWDLAGYVLYEVQLKHTMIKNMFVTSTYTDRNEALAAIERNLKKITARLRDQAEGGGACSHSPIDWHDGGVGAQYGYGFGSGSYGRPGVISAR